MNELTIYQFENQSIRTIPYLDFFAFCLSDCLKAVHSSTTISDSLTAIQENIGDDHVINDSVLDSMGRKIKSWFITESALTFLMSRSRTELGKRFNKWLHTQVLPSIRKSGSYSIPKKVETVNEEEVTINEINETINSIFEGIHIKPELIAGIKLNTIALLKPKLTPIIEESRQLLIQSSSDDRLLLTPTKLGEKLGISGIKMNQLLIEKGLQIENNERSSRKEPKYLPTDYGKEFSTFTLSTGSGDDSTSYQQLKWYDSVLSQIKSKVKS